MDPTQFCAASRLVIVAGKGGVGKTTVTAGLALLAARAGLTTLVVEVEGRSGLASLFGRPPLTYHEAELWPSDDQAELWPGVVRGRTLGPEEALLEYLEDHGLGRVSRRLVRSGALEVVATAAPGIGDLLVLGKVKQLERGGSADLVLLDAPAAGHAISFLHSPRGMLDAVRVGPIHAQARDVLEMLGDPARCQVVLVTLPEETPVNELVDTAYQLEDRVGVALGPIVVNGLYPELVGLDVDPGDAAQATGVALRPGEAEPLAAAAAFRLHRRRLQDVQTGRLAERLPLPQLHLPYLFSTALGPSELATLADELEAGVRALSPVLDRP